MKASRPTVGALLLVLAASAQACKETTPGVGRQPAERKPEQATSASAAPSEPPELASELVQRAIRSEIERASAVSGRNIAVKYSKGVVELTGSVADLLSKERATKIAQSVRGVLSVSNRIVVDAPRVPDPKLTADVRVALTLDAAADALTLDVAAKDAVVTLKGAVDSWVEKDVAELVAKGVRGVESVKNELTVVHSGRRLDAEVESDVVARLRWDALVKSGKIHVSVKDGIVSLKGQVGSAAEAERARRLSSWVLGVRAVDSAELAVHWWAKDADLRDPARDKPSDREISDAIRAAALVDPRVKSYSVHPIVSGGFVTLQGTADSPRARLAAEAIARSTVGVLDVKNEMTVKQSQAVSDAELEKRIAAALERDAVTAGKSIRARVSRAVATLQGRVDTHFERARAEDVALRLRNITAVKNELTVKDVDRSYGYEPYNEPYEPMASVWRTVPLTTSRTDREIREAIASELTWSPFVDAEEVVVTVANGKATLTGTVDSLAERRAATQNAFDGGALFVDNLLNVDSG